MQATARCTLSGAALTVVDCVIDLIDPIATMADHELHDSPFDRTHAPQSAHGDGCLTNV